MITDIWFSSEMTLEEIGHLFSKNILYDAENYWEWIIFDLDGYKIDITCPCESNEKSKEYRIFLIDNSGYPSKSEFSLELQDTIVKKLALGNINSIKMGRWKYIKGEAEFEKKVIKEK